MLTMFLCINFSTDFSVRHPLAQPSTQHTIRHVSSEKLFLFTAWSLTMVKC